MKLTIEYVHGVNTEHDDVRHISITDTERIAVVWWELMEGARNTFGELEPKPRRIILEFGADE